MALGEQGIAGFQVAIGLVVTSRPVIEAGQGKMQRRHGWLVRLAATLRSSAACAEAIRSSKALFLGEIIGKNKVNMRVVRIGRQGLPPHGRAPRAVAADQFDARHQQAGPGNGRAVLHRLAIGGERASRSPARSRASARSE
jgi:hypothetical protein